MLTTVQSQSRVLGSLVPLLGLWRTKPNVFQLAFPSSSVRLLSWSRSTLALSLVENQYRRLELLKSNSGLGIKRIGSACFGSRKTERSSQVPISSFSMSATMVLSPTKQNSEVKKFKLDSKENEGTDDCKLYFRKMTSTAHTPTKGSKYAAGYDLKSAYQTVVPARGSCLVKTDIQIKLPSGTYGRVAPRSGLALKHKIDVGAGVIDEDYRGNIGVILFNHGDEDFKVEVGDRIAQLICEKIAYPEIVEVENLEDSERGANGFGSTGVKD